MIKVNVHVGAAVPSRDRQRLERLCRYVARPPIAQERLELTADGQKAGRVLEGKTYDAMPGTALTVPSRAYR
jgi:hypothetical protein